MLYKLAWAVDQHHIKLKNPSLD